MKQGKIKRRENELVKAIDFVRTSLDASLDIVRFADLKKKKKLERE